MSRLVAAPLPVEVVETDARPVRGLAFRVPRCLAVRRWASPLVAVLLLLSLVGVAIGQSTMLLGASRAVFLGAAGSSNVVAVEVGSFTKATSTGNQDVTISTNLTTAGSGTWSLMLTMGGSLSSSGTWGANYRGMIGVAANGGGSVSNFAACIQGGNGENPTRTSRRIAAAVFTVPNLDGSTVVDEATFTSFPSSTTMRLNWGTASSDAFRVDYLLISGLTGAKAVNWQGPASTGTKAVTGVGFRPDLVIHFADGDTTVPSSAGRGFFGWGVMNSAGEQWTNSIVSDDNLGSSNTSSWQRTDSCLMLVNASEGTTLARTAFSSMDSDGFTTNFATNGLGNTYQYFSLCMKGVTSKIGSFTVSSTPQTISHALGKTPKGAIFSTVSRGVDSNPAAGLVWGVGVTDLTNQRSVSIVDSDNVIPTFSENVWESGVSVGVVNAPATPQERTMTTGTFTTTNYVATFSSTSGITTIEILDCLIG